jgi:hypothetical protein
MAETDAPCQFLTHKMQSNTAYTRPLPSASAGVMMVGFTCQQVSTGCFANASYLVGRRSLSTLYNSEHQTH